MSPRLIGLMLGLLLVTLAGCDPGSPTWTIWGRFETTLYEGTPHQRTIVQAWHAEREFPTLDACQRWKDQSYASQARDMLRMFWHLECLPSGQVPR